ncbi:TIGR04086 family membrane protein [Cohnella lupini]|uniref:Putative membrane protein (TIGR04086 family) n=1 Tax=Cohnella lupini TaxID=1294267 RepID=A0A3D9IQX1_9BACL|nr:TIGR04086 family membrane protein [Cohnella lupini]RED64142.1 putative membrane protein (TIGR04086 family) [Cohnella lupini]
MSSLSRLFGLRNASPFASGLYWSGIWLAIGAIALSIVLMGSSLSESNMLPWVFGVHGCASLAGGFVSAKRSGRRGWYFGMANGLVYTLLLLTISFLATDANWSSAVPILLLVTSLAGAFGGMLGVNAGANSR